MFHPARQDALTVASSCWTQLYAFSSPTNVATNELPLVNPADSARTKIQNPFRLLGVHVAFMSNGIHLSGPLILVMKLPRKILIEILICVWKAVNAGSVVDSLRNLAVLVSN
ncbi:hypothetical protein TNCV_4843311 [Trichonephila clavipes]|uniref:Uncharacterized protein n=1 Tax=Trichonephila clavipes TaxID=2585209 RepID=A0A8X7BMU6_TRICX|nr:hypothetical protein TNCV_4843311 [Trichonephila clavipes]